MSGTGHGHDDRSLRWLRRAVTVPYLWLLLFFLAPFLIILKISVADPVVAQPPFTPLLEWGAEGFEGLRVTFANYLFLFQDGYYGIIYFSSLKMAAVVLPSATREAPVSVARSSITSGSSSAAA